MHCKQYSWLSHLLSSVFPITKTSHILDSQHTFHMNLVMGLNACHTSVTSTDYSRPCWSNIEACYFPHRVTAGGINRPVLMNHMALFSNVNTTEWDECYKWNWRRVVLPKVLGLQNQITSLTGKQIDLKKATCFPLISLLTICLLSKVQMLLCYLFSQICVCP